MRALFFVSGISAYYALQKRTAYQYFIERCKKLLLPTIFALLCICPIMAYFMALNEKSFQGSLIKFFPEFFIKFETYLGWAHFWFLIYLFVYSIIFLLFRLIIKTGTITKKIAGFLSQGRNIMLPMLVIIAFETLLRPIYPGRQTLVNDWANFTVYLTFFLLGIIWRLIIVV